MDIRQQYRSMQGRFIGPWSLLSAPTFFFWRCKLHKVPDGKLLVAECRLSLFQCNSILNIGRHIKLINFDLNPIFIHLQGVLFYWSALKMTKCQTLKKFWHLELFWWDLLCNLTLCHFLGRTGQKNHPVCIIQSSCIKTEMEVKKSLTNWSKLLLMHQVAFWCHKLDESVISMSISVHSITRHLLF